METNQQFVNVAVQLITALKESEPQICSEWARVGQRPLEQAGRAERKLANHNLSYAQLTDKAVQNQKCRNNVRARRLARAKKRLRKAQRGGK